MLKPSLQLRFSQQLTMTPQLQQAIKLLQLNRIELQPLVQQELMVQQVHRVQLVTECLILRKQLAVLKHSQII